MSVRPGEPSAQLIWTKAPHPASRGSGTSRQRERPALARYPFRLRNQYFRSKRCSRPEKWLFPPSLSQSYARLVIVPPATVQPGIFLATLCGQSPRSRTAVAAVTRRRRGSRAAASAAAAQNVATTAPWYRSTTNFLASGDRNAATNSRIAGEFTLSGLAATRFA